MTSLASLVIAGDVDAVRARVQESPEDIIAPFNGALGGAAVHYAAYQCRTDMLQLMLRALPTAAVAPGSRDAMTPLHHAARSRKRLDGGLLLRQTCEILLDTAPHAVSVASSTGWTPLHLAVHEDNHVVAEVLVRRGASVMALDNEASTPLHFVQSPDMARLLLAAGAQPVALNADNETPLHAAFNSDEDYPCQRTVEFLASAAPAALLSTDRFGYTPLHRAVYNSCHDVLRLFVDLAPAAVTMALENGETPLHLLSYDSEWNPALGTVVDVLSAAAGVVDQDGRTPLELALSEGSLRLAAELVRLGPAEAVLRAIGRQLDDCTRWPTVLPQMLPLYRSFLLAPGRLPLSGRLWDRVPNVPFLDLSFVGLALQSGGVEQAAYVVRRLVRPDADRLRAILLSLNRFDVPCYVLDLVLPLC